MRPSWGVCLPNCTRRTRYKAHFHGWSRTPRRLLRESKTSKDEDCEESKYVREGERENPQPSRTRNRPKEVIGWWFRYTLLDTAGWKVGGVGMQNARAREQGTWSVYTDRATGENEHGERGGRNYTETKFLLWERKQNLETTTITAATTSAPSRETIFTQVASAATKVARWRTATRVGGRRRSVVAGFSTTRKSGRRGLQSLLYLLGDGHFLLRTHKLKEERL